MGYKSYLEIKLKPKHLLKSGDMVTYDGTTRYVLLETMTLHDCTGYRQMSLDNFNDDLQSTSCTITIVKITRGLSVIWSAESPKDRELKRIEDAIKKLASELEEVRKW